MKHFLFLLLTLAGARAQYSIDWSTTDAGGGSSSGGVYALSGTVGQSDAAAVATGGSFSLDGGYWTFTDPAPPMPEMSLTLDSGFAILTWPDPGIPVVLETSTDLSLWTPVDPQPAARVWAEEQSNRSYYRLRPGP